MINKNPSLLTWNELAKLIDMSESERNQHVVSQNDSTGAFFGFIGIEKSDEDQDLPNGHIILIDDANWYRIKNGVPETNQW